jgi:ATP-dependent Zn protease
MHTPWVRRAAFACALMTLLAIGGVSVAAQTPTAAPTTGGTFTGKISNTNPLTVNSNGQDRQLNTTARTTVIRDGKAAAVGDLKTGDQVNVTSNPDNTIANIQTTSVAKSGSGIWKWLIPLLIALLIIGLLAYFLSRRKKDAFVLERDRTNTPTR